MYRYANFWFLVLDYLDLIILDDVFDVIVFQDFSLVLMIFQGIFMFFQGFSFL